MGQIDIEDAQLPNQIYNSQDDNAYNDMVYDSKKYHSIEADRPAYSLP